MIVLSVHGGRLDVGRLHVPDTESQHAYDLLEERFPAQSGSDARVVFAAPDGGSLDDDTSRAAVSGDLGRHRWAARRRRGHRPFADGTISPERTIAFADVTYLTSASEVPEEAIVALEESAARRRGGRPSGAVRRRGDGRQRRGTGRRVGDDRTRRRRRSCCSCRSGRWWRWACPLLTAIIGLGIGLTGITVMANFLDVSSTAPILATMIGLAVGIDYALFIVTRHRQNLAEGFDVEESAARANATAGGAVVFAGLTVVIALAGLAVVGIPFLTVMGFAAAATVLVAIGIAITLIPALLGFAGRNIDRWRIGRARTGSHAESTKTLSSRWARRVTERPGRRPSSAVWRSCCCSPCRCSRCGWA